MEKSKKKKDTKCFFCIYTAISIGIVLLLSHHSKTVVTWEEDIFKKKRVTDLFLKKGFEEMDDDVAHLFYIQGLALDVGSRPGIVIVNRQV